MEDWNSGEAYHITFTSSIAELFDWFSGFLFGKRNKGYVGKHYPSTVEVVPPDWHPEPTSLRYSGLWTVRFTRYAQFAFLRMPVVAFKVWLDIGEEVSKVVNLSDWRWTRVPFHEWPSAWRQAA